ncbi:MAG: AMP-binding protein [Opitutaceae bacterium]
METIAPFDIEALKRDWIEGIAGDVFSEEVSRCASKIKVGGERVQLGGVLICEQDPVAFAAAFFAAVSLSVPVVLANPRWGRFEWAAFQPLVNPVLTFGNPSFEPQDVQYDPLSRGSILIPTGGTTGGVKLAIHTWSSLHVAARSVADFLGGGPVNSCCCLPLFHVSGLMQLIRSFVSDGCIRFDDTKMEGYCLSLVPTQLQRLLQDEMSCRKLATARAIFVGGAGMPASVSEQARALRLPIIPVYGMTETAAMVAAVPSDDFIGSPSAGAVPVGEARFQIEPDGRLRIHSPALFIGYQGQAAIDPIEGYLTDDEARIDEDGKLHVLGRADRLIISGGEKIDPREVEDAIREVAGLQEVIAIGYPDAEWGEKLVAFYVDRPGSRRVSEWQDSLREQLANYKFPKQLISVPKLPVDERGKLDWSMIHTAVEDNFNKSR